MVNRSHCFRLGAELRSIRAPFRHHCLLERDAFASHESGESRLSHDGSYSIIRRIMIHLRHPKPLAAAITLSAALAVWLAPPTASVASNHIDSPLTTQDRGANITDHWAFLDPNDNSKIVLVLGTQGFIISGEHFGMDIFDPHQRYRWEIENTGDAIPDKYIDVYYSPGVGHLTAQTATIVLPNGHRFTAPTTIAVQTPQPNPPVVKTDSATGVRFFAGVMDDPFFLDDTGANRFVASSVMHPGHPDRALLGLRGGRDTYAGFNTLITAIELPVSMLKGKGDVIGIHAVTQRQAHQTLTEDGELFGWGGARTIDREGVPFINNLLIPPPLKSAFATSNTLEDARGKFKTALVKSLKALATDDAHIATILALGQKNGDILRLNVKVANYGPGGGTNANGGYLHGGGRRLQDDVVTETFTLINNGVRLTDNVFHNDHAFRNVFPFVADPNQPYPPGHEPSNMFQ